MSFQQSPLILDDYIVQGLFYKSIQFPIKKLVKTRCGYLHIVHGYRTPVQAEVEHYKYSDENLFNAA